MIAGRVWLRTGISELTGFALLLLIVVVSATATAETALSWRTDLSEKDKARVASVTAPAVDFTAP